MAATTKEREYQAELQSELNESSWETEDRSELSAPKSSPNLVVFIFIAGIAFVLDIVGLIPIVCMFTNLIFLGINGLWKVSTGSKISMVSFLVNGARGISPIPTPFGNTISVAVDYFKNTGIGQKTQKITGFIK